MKPIYSIVIPTVFSKNLEPCLESVLKYTNMDLVEIIIVANGYDKPLPSDPSNKIKVIWFDDKIGYSKAVNEGIKASVGAFVVPLNDDTVLRNQRLNLWLDILVDPFLKDGDVGITGPMRTFSPSANRSFLIFFCVMIKREMFEKIGLLDESFAEGYGEDTHFCLQLKDAGYKMIQVCPTDKFYPNSTVMDGDFPIDHAGNRTFIHFQDDGLIHRNNKLLHDRYVVGQPNIERAKKCDGFMNNNELRWLGRESMNRGKE